MPWDMKDYPNSFKNLDELVRKKGIDLLNALIAEGYPEDRAIPIAISQAKKWYENASTEEKEEWKKAKNPQKTDKHGGKKINQDLLDNDVLVYYEDGKWLVKTKNAEKASDSFQTKAEAEKRAKEIAENKESKVISYKKDEKID